MKLILQAKILNIVASVFFKVVSSRPVRFMVCKQFVTTNAINLVRIFDIMVSQTNGGYSNLGARGKDFQKLMSSRKEKGL